MQQPSKLLVDLFKAYYDARKNKRKSPDCLAFEMNYEENIFKLYHEIINNQYNISRSLCFISFNPVQREIFAGNFRDRIVHHLIYNALSSLFERLFIYDDYSCRLKKGVSLGIRRTDYFIRSCSKNYSQDCWILKLDIKGYFMSIDKKILYEKIKKVVCDVNNEFNFDKELLLHLVYPVIFHDPTKHCYMKGIKEDWVGLPKTKSLFFAKKGKGLPIGNLTSQLFGNVYLNDFDHFVKTKLRCKYYGRYVDDMVFVHQDKEYLKSIIPKISNYLKKELDLEIHPKKIYLQYFSKGVLFLGVVIKPYRIYIGQRNKRSFYKKIMEWNKIIENQKGQITEDQLKTFLAVLNSYLGCFYRCSSYKLCQKLVYKNLSSYFAKYICITKGYKKAIVSPVFKNVESS
ncbi:MAG: RNA-directed DNA polymerase [Patescibacteria group bacterium]|nr:RNA-directed DNA polymerase [Patescibacteria group bacterium]